MSLLELLKEHLKEWPKGVVALAQDSNGEMASAHSKHYAEEAVHYLRTGTHVWLGAWWYSAADPKCGEPFWVLPVADDAATAIVTREMWEAA